jgi:hypothetical protein
MHKVQLAEHSIYLTTKPGKNMATSPAESSHKIITTLHDYQLNVQSWMTDINIPFMMCILI